MDDWKQRIKGMAYLAIPYTGSLGDKAPMEQMEQSFQVANGVSGYFMTKGEIVFSPISHSHPIHFYMGDRGVDHDFWMKYNRAMVEYCNRLYVVCFGDWKKSNGVRIEMKWFQDANKPIFLIALRGGGRLSIACVLKSGRVTFPSTIEERGVIVDTYA